MTSSALILMLTIWTIVTFFVVRFFIKILKKK